MAAFKFAVAEILALLHDNFPHRKDLRYREITDNVLAKFFTGQPQVSDPEELGQQVANGAAFAMVVQPAIEFLISEGFIDVKGNDENLATSVRLTHKGLLALGRRSLVTGEKTLGEAISDAVKDRAPELVITLVGKALALG